MGSKQPRVDDLFSASTEFWADIYTQKDTTAVIHQHRRARALRWVDELAMPRGTRVLEAGCGAGLLAVALARRGFRVEATDRVPAMARLAREHADRAGVGGQMRVALADVQALGFRSEEFDLVVALGVIPWVPSPVRAIAEMVRVLQPGGLLLVNASNRARLTYLLDPLCTPALAPVRRGVNNGLARLGLPSRYGADRLRTNMHSCAEFDALLSSNGLAKLKGATFGFGPFTFMGRTVLPDSVGVAVHRKLQRLVDRGFPGLARSGVQYIVLARKIADP